MSLHINLQPAHRLGRGFGAEWGAEGGVAPLGSAWLPTV